MILENIENNYIQVDQEGRLLCLCPQCNKNLPPK